MNMKLLKITRTNTEVRYEIEVKTETGVEIQKFEAHDAPLQKFDDALQALAAVSAKVLEVPAEWASGITVQTLDLSYTKAGTRSAQVFFTKALDATTCQHPLKTPTFQIEDGGKGEDSRRQCSPKHSEFVLDMIKQAVAYAGGKRQQMQLGFDEKKGDESAKERKRDAENGQAGLKLVTGTDAGE